MSYQRDDTKSMPQIGADDIESGRKLDIQDEDFSDSTPLLTADARPAPRPETLDDAPKKVELWRIFQLALPEKWLLIGGTVALLFASLTVLAIPAFAGMIVNSVVQVPSDDSSECEPNKFANFIFHNGCDPIPLNKAMVLLFAIFACGSVFAFFRAAMFTIAGERVVARMRKMLFNSIMKQEIGFYDATRTGELTNRLASDTTVLQNTVTVNLSMSMRYVAQAIGAFLLLIIISWKLTLVMMSCIPVVAIGAVAYGMFVKKLAKRRQDALAKASEVAEEAFSNIRTVRSFSKEDYEMDKYADRVQESYVLGRNIGLAYGGFAGGIALAAQIALGVVLWYGAILVTNDPPELSPGDLTSFLMYTLTVAFALGGMSALYADFMKAAGASERVFQLMDREPQVRFTGGRCPDAVEGLVSFENVSFTYPTRPDAEVLKNINFTLSPGEVFALVGPSGGGKTTVANLIEMFYYPSKGRITLDGNDLSTLDVQWVHDHVGIVSQNPSLFATSIRDNIAYGMSDVPLEDIIHAARLANAHEFIDRFPEKYDTMVGERGVRLSGGQKQRIAIARALLKDPRVLLLDEATSNLDAQSEHLVQEALDRLMKGRSVLVIAHRLSTVRNANSILVIKRGEVVERGTHEQLMKQNGVYVNLVRRQLEPGGVATEDVADTVEEWE